MDEGFQRQLVDKLNGISASIRNLATTLKDMDRRQSSGLLSGSEAMERHRKGVRETRKEKREETQLKMLMRSHILMARQNRIMFLTLIVTAASVVIGVILEVVKFFYPHLAK